MFDLPLTPLTLDLPDSAPARMLSKQERIELIEKLTDVVKHDTDQVLFFSLGPVGGQREQTVYTVGLAYKPPEHEAVIV